jgi:hypothetical protein
VTQELIASFVVDRAGGDHWCGAIYAWRNGLGPELVMHCTHHHRSMHKALDCAVAELTWARRIVEMREHYRDIAS